MSNRRERSVSDARRAIKTTSPSQMASSSACVIVSGCGNRRPLDEELIVGDLAKNQESAVPQHGDARQRGDGEPLPIGFLHPGLEPETLGAAQHVGNADSRDAHPMPNLARLGRDAVAAQQCHQGRKPGFVGVRRSRLCHLCCNFASVGAASVSRRSAHADRRVGKGMTNTLGQAAPADKDEFRQAAPADTRVGEGMTNALHEARRSGGDHAAIPDRLEFRTRDQLGMRCGWIQDERPVVVGPSKKQKSAIAQRRNSGQPHADQSLPMRRARTRSDPKLPGTAEHRADADRRSPAALADLIERGIHAMKAQEQPQGKKPGVLRLDVLVLHRHSSSALRDHVPDVDVHFSMHAQKRNGGLPRRQTQSNTASTPTTGRRGSLGTKVG